MIGQCDLTHDALLVEVMLLLRENSNSTTTIAVIRGSKMVHAGINR